jgi:hypothetical protein
VTVLPCPQAHLEEEKQRQQAEAQQQQQQQQQELLQAQEQCSQQQHDQQQLSQASQQQHQQQQAAARGQSQHAFSSGHGSANPTQQQQQQQPELHLPSFKRLRSTVNARDLYRRTPLLVAAKHGHLECAQLLSDAAANIFAVDREGNT